MAIDKVTDSGGTNGRAAEVVEEWRNAAYNCFSSGHKFCREVCPVMQVTRDERHTPTAFHANVVAMDEGHLTIEDVAEDYVHCTMCGACELRCPNTLFTGDFYRFRTRTVDVVKAVRALAVDQGIHQPGWQSWNERTNDLTHEPVLGAEPVSQAHVRDWAEGLGLAIGGETVLFVDCEAAFYRTSVPRAVAQILQRAGYEFGLMGEQWCCGGPAAEMGYVDQARRFAQHNLDNWRSTGTKRVLVLDPHDYISFTEDYPKYFGADYDIEVVLVVELLAQLLREGKLKPTKAIERAITYHDPCRLNKRKGIWQELQRLNPSVASRVVFMTGDTMSADAVKFLQETGRPVLTKPLSIDRVGRIVEDVLASNAAAAAAATN